MSDLKKRAVPILIGGYQIDASISESHQFESTITEFPVEQGSAISDNIVPKSVMVTIEGIVSDTPIGPIATLRNQQAASSDFLPVSDPKAAFEAVKGSTFIPSVDARTALLAIRDARQPITISTSIRTYENMALQTLDIPVDASTGAAFRFSATFKQIIIVTNARTTIRTATKRTASPSGQGKKLSGKQGAITGFEGVFCFTHQPWFHDLYVKQYGQPLTTDELGDHFKWSKNIGISADGYIGNDNKYHQFSPFPSDYLNGATAPTTSGTKIGGKTVSFDPKTNNYTTSDGNSISKVPSSKINSPSFVSQALGKAAPGG